MRGIHEGPQLDPEDPTPAMSGARPKMLPLLLALAALLLTSAAHAQTVNSIQDGPDGVDPTGVKGLLHFQIQPQPAITSSLFAVIAVGVEGPKWAIVRGMDDFQIDAQCTRRQGDYCWGICTAMCPVDQRLDDAECVADGHGGSSCVCYGHKEPPQFCSQRLGR